MKSPNVRKVIGRVRKIKRGLTNIFSRASTMATIIADVYPSTQIPGNILAKITTANAVNNNFTIVFIGVIFKD